MNKILPIIVIFGVLVLIELLALAKLVYSLASYQRYWSKNTSQTELKYIALGDSAAQGIGASRPEKGYVGLLSRHLGAAEQTINLSVSGAKVADVIAAQLPKLTDLNINADTVITLDIGGNDMRDFEPARFEREINDLYSKLPKQTIVADVPYFGGGRYRHLEQNVELANGIIRRAAQKHELKIAPLHQITKDRDSLLVYSSDFFHPSNIGYKNWFEAYRTALDS